jgi:DNA-binding NtrC family response regulator
MSKRARASLVRLNCAGIPPDLSESELFGLVRGEFTGADRNRQGFFSSAKSGTVVLDEIGELPLPTQPKLLRVRQNGERGRLRTVVRAHRAYRPQVPQNRQMPGLLAFRLTRHVSRTACLCGWSVGN